MRPTVARAPPEEVDSPSPAIDAEAEDEDESGGYDAIKSNHRATVGTTSDVRRAQTFDEVRRVFERTRKR